MTLEIHTTAKESAVSEKLVADRRICIADDQHTVVEETDPRSAFLLAAQGHVISAEDAKRLKLSMVDGKIVQEGAAEDPSKVPLMHQLNAEKAIEHVMSLETSEAVAAAKADEESRKGGARKSVVKACDEWAAELVKAGK